jgi:hypothetical protein
MGLDLSSSSFQSPQIARCVRMESQGRRAEGYAEPVLVPAVTPTADCEDLSRARALQNERHR